MKREGNYDLLRIISAVAVVMIHVSSIWFDGAVESISKSGLSVTDIQSPYWICIYGSLSRFAVPCFVMLSGAFILENEKNIEYKRFYSKSFAKIGIPAIIFSVVYIFYAIPGCFFGVERGIVTLLKSIIKGVPMYHMWYLYMLVGVYALAPVVLRFKNSISEKSFQKVAFIFCIWACISYWTQTRKLSWDMGQSFEYLGYFMVGYCIRKMSGPKNNLKALLMILFGLLFELCAAGLQYQQMKAGISELRYGIVAPYCPLIVPASILIFYGFTLLDIKKEFTKLSGLTFYIYLIHAGVWDFICKLFWLIKGRDYPTKLDGAVWILVFTIAVFIVSCLLSRLYLYLWGKLDKNGRITNCIVKVVGLQRETGRAD